MKSINGFEIRSLPTLILERDFKTNEWTVWNTELHKEEYRGLRNEAIDIVNGSITKPIAIEEEPIVIEEVVKLVIAPVAPIVSVSAKIAQPEILPAVIQTVTIPQLNLF